MGDEEKEDSDSLQIDDGGHLSIPSPFSRLVHTWCILRGWPGKCIYSSSNADVQVWKIFCPISCKVKRSLLKRFHLILWCFMKKNLKCKQEGRAWFRQIPKFCLRQGLIILINGGFKSRGKETTAFLPFRMGTKLVIWKLRTCINYVLLSKSYCIFWLYGKIDVIDHWNQPFFLEDSIHLFFFNRKLFGY